jgi:hypothetical protein
MREWARGLEMRTAHRRLAGRLGYKANGRRRRRKNPWYGQKRRHARAARKGWARRRRSYRRNPVIPVSYNPRRRRHYRRNSVLPISLNPNGIVGDLMRKVQSLVNVSFWIDTAFPATAGFLGAKVAGGFVQGLVEKTGLMSKLPAPEYTVPIVRAITTAIGGALVSKGIGMVKGRNAEDKAWLGTIIAVAYDLAKAFLGGTQIGNAIGLSGMGNSMQDAVAARVRRELAMNGAVLSGMGTYLDVTDLQRQSMGEYITDVALRRQNGYSASPSGDLRDYDVSRTETNF